MTGVPAARGRQAGPPAAAPVGRVTPATRATPATGPLAGLRGILGRPLASYHLILGITTLLLALGLVMVLSTSSVQGLAQGQSPFSGFQHQLLGVVVGIACMGVASRLRAVNFRAAVYPLMFLTIVALLLVQVPGVGYHSGGVTREIQLGPLLVQPSELAKLAFLLWGADLLARKEKLGKLEDWRHLLIPLLPGAGMLSMLVMLGDDLGTTFILLVIFLALLWVIGTPGPLYAGILAMIGLVLLILAVVANYRFQRLTSFLTPAATPQQALSTKWQGTQGKWAVGSGSWFGYGLGASRQKWGYVPNDTTDFIFAIIGEELGLVGTLCVAFLYGSLAYAGIRIARRVDDTFVRLAAAGATAWIVIEALVNMGAVLGLLPITGVPLPLVSSGLSSLLVTMTALGMLMSFAKLEPGAAEALAVAGPGVARRTLSWLGLDRRRRE